MTAADLTTITGPLLSAALREAIYAVPAEKRGAATIDATLSWLEARVGWRVAPWWSLTGIVQKPWSGPLAAGVRTTFIW